MRFSKECATIGRGQNLRDAFTAIVLVFGYVLDRIRGGIFGEPKCEQSRDCLNVQDVASENEGLGRAGVGE